MHEMRDGRLACGSYVTNITWGVGTRLVIVIGTAAVSVYSTLTCSSCCNIAMPLFSVYHII